MMSTEVCLKWQESQQRLPCRLAENRVHTRTGRAATVSEPGRRDDLLPSGVRLVHAAGRLARQRINHIKSLHILHFSSHLISSSQPLIASSLCSHARQARGKIAMACTNQHCKRVKQSWTTLGKTACASPIQKRSMLHRHPMRRQ